MEKPKRKVRNYLVMLVVRKSGAGRHRNKKREAKTAHDSLKSISLEVKHGCR